MTYLYSIVWIHLYSASLCIYWVGSLLHSEKQKLHRPWTGQRLVYNNWLYETRFKVRVFKSMFKFLTKLHDCIHVMSNNNCRPYICFLKMGKQNKWITFQSTTFSKLLVKVLSHFIYLFTSHLRPLTLLCRTFSSSRIKTSASCFLITASRNFICKI